MEGNFTRYLHGTLQASIFYATDFTPSFPFNCMLLRGKPAYVTMELDQTTLAETKQKKERVWNQTFEILCAYACHPTATITITLRTRFSTLGKLLIPAHHLLMEAAPFHYNGLFPLTTEQGKLLPKLKLRFCLHFKHAGVANATFSGLTRGITFPQRSNCEVTLYQDAHHTPHFQPPLHVGSGQLYRPRKLWEDVYKAIDGAQHLVYIAGWSLNPKLPLVRDPETEIQKAKGVTIGELLKQKAEEGVVVRVMLWDDETSLPIINNKGVMNTHDEDAFVYFKHTKVVCRLCPRLHHKFPTLFTHHQKTITVDAQVQQPHHDLREIISFVGGLDLCDGRYDTEEHSLFRTLNTESHANDFYQINIDGADLHRGGPREPWHDTHACINGQAAWDVLANFEQRWTKQCESSLLPSTSKIPCLIQTSNTMQHHHYNWNVQVFRSIDAMFLPDKNCAAECSIHAAYVEAIRRAERFIYIENQYFIGGCHLWEKDKNSKCNNLIPIEIALKVARKIRLGEQFAAYIVIPLWPEGVPESEIVQDMLHWTRLTMSMMYRLIGEAIEENGKEVHPRDYLNFFCLANREKKMDIGEFIPPSSPHYTSNYWRSQMHRRFMIYVHSKLMIVDDEYILMGSANVNQRSMDGRRDTEISIGCYQPEFVGDKTGSGDIHRYRMSLWYEHTRRIEQVFLQPESLDCVRTMVGIGEEMWSIYSGEEILDMDSVHLINYPIHVLRNGCIEDLVECGGAFPDTNALVKGKRSKLLPPIFTT